MLDVRQILSKYIGLRGSAVRMSAEALILAFEVSGGSTVEPTVIGQ